MFHVGEASERQGKSTKESLIIGFTYLFRVLIATLVQRFHHTKYYHILFFPIHCSFSYMSFCQTFYYTYIFFHFQTFHHCTVNNYKPTPFLFQAQPPILIIPVEGWLDRWPLLVIPTTIWAEVHLLPEIKVPITVRLVSKEDQDAVRLWPLLQGTVYKLLLEVWQHYR